MDTKILVELGAIRQELTEIRALKKEVLTFDDACQYLNVSSSHLYKLTSKHQIPCYKPNGKKLYFKRAELENWLLRHHKNSSEDVEQLASNYLLSKGKRKGGKI